MINDLKIGSLVVTSRSRYGTIIDEKTENGIDKKLVRIGNKQYWINADQLIVTSNVINFKVYYSFDYCGKLIEDSCEVPIKKGTKLFDINNPHLIIETINDILYKKLNQRVNINKIEIS